MDEIKVYDFQKANQGNPWFMFQLEEDEMIIVVDVIYHNNSFVWTFSMDKMTEFGKKRWHFYLDDKKFVSDTETLPNEVKEKINILFYKAIRQIKHHPNYRLKTINMLHEQMREVWDQV